MAHCPFDKLDDLTDVLEAVRLWDKVKEKGPAVFYVGSTPFLHFHLKDGRRWADVRAGKDWGPSLEIPLGAKRLVRAAFLREVRRCYDLTATPKR